jgi:hypothetical protein
VLVHGRRRSCCCGRSYFLHVPDRDRCHNGEDRLRFPLSMGAVNTSDYRSPCSLKTPKSLLLTDDAIFLFA